MLPDLRNTVSPSVPAVVYAGSEYLIRRPGLQCWFDYPFMHRMDTREQDGNVVMRGSRLNLRGGPNYATFDAPMWVFPARLGLRYAARIGRKLATSGWPAHTMLLVRCKHGEGWSFGFGPFQLAYLIAHQICSRELPHHASQERLERWLLRAVETDPRIEVSRLRDYHAFRLNRQAWMLFDCQRVPQARVEAAKRILTSIPPQDLIHALGEP